MYGTVDNAVDEQINYICMIISGSPFIICGRCFHNTCSTEQRSPKSH